MVTKAEHDANVRKVALALIRAQDRSALAARRSQAMQHQATHTPMMAAMGRPANAARPLAPHLGLGTAITEFTRRNPMDLSIGPLEIDMSFRNEPGYKPEKGYNENFLDKDGKGYIPSRVIGEHGATVLTFDNDVAGGDSTYLPVDGRLRDMIMSMARRSGFESMNINSTTGGNRRNTSPHPHGWAVDINNINGLRVDNPNSAENVRHLQDLGHGQKDIDHNYGPAYLKQNTENEETGEWELKSLEGRMPTQKDYDDLVRGHQNHVHLSVKRLGKKRK